MLILLYTYIGMHRKFLAVEVSNDFWLEQNNLQYTLVDTMLILRYITLFGTNKVRGKYFLIKLDILDGNT